MSGTGLTDGLALGLCETNAGFYWESGLGGDGLDDADGVTNGLLLESGGFILLEDGGILLLES